MSEINNLTKLNKILCLVLTLLIFLIVALHLNLNYELTSGGFVGRVLSFINFNKYSQNYTLFSSMVDNPIYTDNLQPIAKDLSGLTYMISFLSEVTGISSHYLMLIPFGVFFTSLSYYILFKSIFDDFWVAFLSMIYILFYTITSNDQLGGYVASWTYILFSFFIIFNVRILEKKTPTSIIVMLLMYLGLNLYWHTMEARALFFTFSINIIIILFKQKKFDLNWSPANTISVFLAMLITTLYFQEILYTKTGYIANASFDNFILSYFEWIQNIAAKIGIISIETQIKSPFYYTPSSTVTMISTYTGLILIFFILFPILISCITDIRSIKVGSQKSNKLYCIKYSFLLTQTILMVTYGLAGGAGPGLIIHFFPIVSIIGIIQLKNYFSLYSKNRDFYFGIFKRFKFKGLAQKSLFEQPIRLFLVLLIFFNCIYCTPFLMEKYNPTTTYKECIPASFWLIDKSYIDEYPSKLVLTDYITVGKFLVLSSEKGILFNYKCYSPLSYQLLVDNDFSKFDWNYMIVNVKSIDVPIMTDQGWTRLNPLSYYTDTIESNTKLNKIYSDNFFIIYF